MPTAATLTPERSRSLAIALLLLAIVAAISIVAVPFWMWHRHYDSAIEDNQSKLERFRRIAATRPEMTKQLEAMRARETRRFFLRSGAPALSAAEASETLRGIIEQSGGRLITMQAQPPREEGRYRQIGVTVQLTANVFAVRKILHAIETSMPYLFVENLMIRTQVQGNFRPGPGAEPEMFVNLDAHGYSLTGNP